jgi:membrane fusion protein, multidrug efflux system
MKRIQLNSAKGSFGLLWPNFSQGPLCLLTIGVFLAAGACSLSRSGSVKASSTDRESKALSVRETPVQLEQIQRTVQAVGSLLANEQVVVSAEVEGKCDKVLVDIGDRVSQGQELVVLSPVELALAAEQQAAVLDQARARLGLADEQEEIRDVSQAAGVKKAAADLADAQQKFQRAQELMDQGLLPRQSYEEAESRQKAAQASYDLAVQEARTLAGSVRQYHASSELAKKKLQDSHIRAPINGYIKDRSVEEGQYVKAQTPVITIVNVDPLRARLAIPEKMAGWVPIGQTVTVTVEAFPDRTFTGKISRINPAVEEPTRSFQAEALIENHEGLLKPGFFVKASIPTTKSEQVLSVPQQALNYSYGVYSVYLISDNKLEQKEVRIGDRTGDRVEILSGLSQGQPVALPAKENVLLREGATVKVVGGGDERGAPGASGPAGAPQSEEAPKSGRGRGRERSQPAT